MSDPFLSKLKKAKNLGGSNTTATKEWWMQRLSSCLLLPSSAWLLFSLKAFVNADAEGLHHLLKNPMNFAVLIIFIITAFYHASLGMKVIIEDYIHKSFFKVSALVILEIFSFVTIVCTIVALIYFVGGLS